MPPNYFINSLSSYSPKGELRGALCKDCKNFKEIQQVHIGGGMYKWVVQCAVKPNTKSDDETSLMVYCDKYKQKE